jgi:hypothetical protein
MDAMVENGKFDEINDLQKELMRNNKDLRNVSSLVKEENFERIVKINEMKERLKGKAKFRSTCQNMNGSKMT